MRAGATKTAANPRRGTAGSNSAFVAEGSRARRFCRIAQNVEQGGACCSGGERQELGADGDASILQEREVFVRKLARDDDELRHRDGNAFAGGRHMTDAQDLETDFRKSAEHGDGERILDRDEDRRRSRDSLACRLPHRVWIVDQLG